MITIDSEGNTQLLAVYMQKQITLTLCIESVDS